MGTFRFPARATEEHRLGRQGTPAHHRRAGARARAARPDYLPLLRREILEVIRKYVNVDPDAIEIHVERDGDSEVLELSVALPERRQRTPTPPTDGGRRGQRALASASPPRR